MRARRFVLLLAIGTVSCALVAGLEDKTLENAPDAEAETAPPDHEASTSAPAGDGGSADADASVTHGEIVAMGQAGPLGIATDDVFVYWGVEGVDGGTGAILRRAKTLGAPAEIVATDQPSPRHLAVDNVYVFWNVAPDVGNTALVKVPRMTALPATPQTVQSENNSRIVDIDLVASDPWLVWAGTDKVVRYTRAGNQKMEVAANSGQTPLQASVVTADATHFYWFNQKTTTAFRRLKAFDDAGAADAAAQPLSQPLAGVLTPIDLRADGKDLVLLTQAGTVYRMDADKPNGPAPTEIARVGGTIGGGAVRNGMLVVTEWRAQDDGRILVIPIASPADQRVIAEKQADPRDIVIDGPENDAWAYWTCHGDGTVRRARLTP